MVQGQVFLRGGGYRLLFKYFCLQPFFLKDSISSVFAISVAPWGGPMVDTKGKMFEIQIYRLLENAYFSDFSGAFRDYTYIQVSLVCL